MKDANNHRAPVNVLSLCAGIGGLDEGIRLAIPGARTVGYVERDAFAQAVLMARMEEETLEPAPIFSDLRGFDGRGWRGCVDIVAAGYPCQPFSVAGSRAGEEDPRHLWPEILRVVREVGARYLVCENVRGHLSLGFDRVLADLAEAGFDVEWTVVRASDAGAPHRRERLFFVAYAGRERDERRRGSGDIHGAAGEAQGEGDQRERGRDTTGNEGANVAHGDLGGREGFGLANEQGQQRPRRNQPDGCGDRETEFTPTVAHARSEGLQGGEQRGALLNQRNWPKAHGSASELRGARGVEWPQQWPPGPHGDWTGIPEWCHPAIEPLLRGVADGPASLLDPASQSRVDRLRCLGNAVVPAQAALAIRELISRSPIR